MQYKMTERDKVLLIVLAIVIVLFAAIMIPQYGIKDLIVSMQDTDKKITEQKAANDEKLLTLAQMGIPAAFAENSAACKNYLQKQILEGKHAAAKWSQVVVSSASYSVANEWLIPLCHLYGIGGNAEVFEEMIVHSNESGFYPATITLYEGDYATKQYAATVQCFTGDNKYVLELEYAHDSVDVQELATLIATYGIFMERGSISIEDAKFLEEGVGEGIELHIAVITPDSATLGEYGREVCECHNCGLPYYKSAYDAALAALDDPTEGVPCEGCEAILDGETLK